LQKFYDNFPSLTILIKAAICDIRSKPNGQDCRQW